eukprot:1074019-Amphidinium_carterae.1
MNKKTLRRLDPAAVLNAFTPIGARVINHVEERGIMMGPIRLLPELLEYHPFPGTVLLVVRLIPSLTLALRRFVKIASLRRSAAKCIAGEVARPLPEVSPLCDVQLRDPCVHLAVVPPIFCTSSSSSDKLTAKRPSVALQTESLALERLNIENHIILDQSRLSALRLAYTVPECDHTLLVGTTLKGASHPFELSRLAWQGDCVVRVAAYLEAIDLGRDAAEQKKVAGNQTQCRKEDTRDKDIQHRPVRTVASIGS